MPPRGSHHDVEADLRRQTAERPRDCGSSDDDELFSGHDGFDKDVQGPAARAGHWMADDTAFELIQIAADADQARSAIRQRLGRIALERRQRAAPTNPADDAPIAVYHRTIAGLGGGGRDGAHHGCDDKRPAAAAQRFDGSLEFPGTHGLLPSLIRTCAPVQPPAPPNSPGCVPAETSRREARQPTCRRTPARSLAGPAAG